jgi:hypothetical protein
MAPEKDALKPLNNFQRFDILRYESPMDSLGIDLQVPSRKSTIL